jgi:hypothetical protein
MDHSQFGRGTHTTRFDRRQSSAVHCLAGSLADRVLLVWGPGNTHEYLLAPDVRRHVWHCRMAAPGGDWRDDPSAFRDRLLKSRSRDIVSEGYGCCPPGLLSALSRLGALARSEGFYRSLVAIMDGGGQRAKLLWHSKTIENRLVEALGGLQYQDDTRRFADAILRRGGKAGDLTSLAWIAGRIQKAYGDADVEQLILSGNNPIRVLQDLLLSLPFPAAPWPELGHLRPIATADELAATGREFSNCLKERARLVEAVIGVQSGQQYFYRWCDTVPALAMFNRFSTLGWALGEIDGVDKSGRIDPHSWKAILKLLAKIPDVLPAGETFWASALLRAR